MRLAPSAFGGGSPNALLALSGRRAATTGKHLATAEAGSRLATTRVHCPQFSSLHFPSFLMIWEQFYKYNYAERKYLLI